MGSTSNSKASWYAIFTYIVILNLSFLSSFSLAITNYTAHISLNSLDNYLYNYTSRLIAKGLHTGVVYNITLPGNFSVMEVSVVRLRSSSLWAKGAKYRWFEIPPRMMTKPFVKRLAIMYENFGNLSSYYYELPGYRLLTRVVGISIYDATDLSRTRSPKRLNITLAGEAIRVIFSKGLRKWNHHRIKCARFDPVNRIVELSKVVKSNVCSSQAVGHFAIVMPRSGRIGPTTAPTPGIGPTMQVSTAAPTDPLSSSRKKRKVHKWWLIGLGGGLAGLILLVSVSVVGLKAIGWRKMRRMETSTDKSEALDTRWINETSKMPSASMIRTQPSLDP